MKRLSLAIAGFALISAGHIQAEANSCGRMVVAKGDIQITSAKAGKTSKARPGDNVCSGDTIAAGADSRAKITMPGGNEINISPDSKLVIEQYVHKPDENQKKVSLNVLYGKIRSKVETKYEDKGNTFQVKTKSAVAGVRGTDFLTGYNASNGQSQVVTFEGRVEVGQPGPGGAILNPVSVGAGQQTLAAPGVPPAAPQPVPAAELNSMSQESNADTGGGPAGTPGPADQPPSADKDEKKVDDKKADGKAEADKGPASDKKADNKNPEGNKGGQAGSSKSGPASGSTSGSTARSPAGGAAMLPPPPPPPPMMSGDLPLIPTIPTVMPTPPPFVTDAIQNGPTKLNITVQY